MSIEITKINIDIDGKNHELTIDQAKELRDALNSIFPVPILAPNPLVVPYIPEPLPYPWDENKPYYGDEWKITCFDATATFQLKS